MAETIAGPVPAEALDYLRKKALRPAFSHLDAWREEHAYQFTVAKVVEAELLSDFKRAVEAVVANGESFGSFQKRLRPTLESKGWWREREVTDPLTGEIRTVDFSAPRRLRLIYDTNVRTAHAAQQWQAIQRTKRLLPYLLYLTGPSLEHRIEHLGWHGVCLPADDPWWDTHFAPNGYGCKCYVRQISQRQYERMKAEGVVAPFRAAVPGGPAQPAARQPLITEAPPMEWQPFVNLRTGETSRIPVGVDPGFGTNVGRNSRLDEAARQFSQKLPTLDAEIGRALFEQVRDYVAPRLAAAYEQRASEVLDWVDRNRGLPRSKQDLDGAPRGDVRMIGVLDTPTLEALASRGRSPASSAITISDKQLAHLYRDTKRPEQAMFREDVLSLPSILSRPEAVLLDRHDGKLLMVFSPQGGPRKGKFVIEIDASIKGKALPSSRPSVTVNEVRTGSLVPIESLADPARYELVTGSLK